MEKIDCYFDLLCKRVKPKTLLNKMAVKKTVLQVMFKD